MDEMVKEFNKEELFILRDCLGLLIKNFYVCENEELPIRDKLEFKNKIEINFALNELSTVLEYIILEEIFPGWEEKEDSISKSRNLGIFGYFRKRKYVMNARELKGIKFPEDSE